ncbi:DinB family protein [Calycomorphotria hydatis]|uniref:DinB family protein n=2 Tax=Calycomorphotria hydatis TaxID=2528027 RepID=A0A517T3X8_9PLAN|nr:DinB family protein [Calycomorphotria hydatis]
MTPTNLIRRLHEHRIWANHRLLDAVEGLTDAELRRPFGIGQGSVWKTLTHLIAAEYVWLGAMQGDESPVMPGDVPDRLPGNQLGDDPIKDLTELRERWAELDGRWRDYLGSLTEEALSEDVYKVSTSSGAGRRFATRRSDILLHICTHAQYTSAQLVNMLKQLGRTDLPDIMLITLARSEKTAELDSR